MGETDPPGRQIKGVRTSLRIVETLVEEDGLGVTDLAERIDLSKGTVHTHLSSLEAGGYVVKDDRQYKPSLRYLRLGSRVREAFDIYKHGRRSADRLANRSGELVYIAVEQDAMVYFIYATRGSDEAIERVTPLGSTRHFHTTASGKSMMAHMDEDRIDRIIAAHGLPRKTEFTITDRESLMADVDAVRRRGYATNNEEQHIGATTVATAVQRSDGTVAGTISVSGPAARFEPDYVEQLATLVKETANNIEVTVRKSS